MHGFVVNCSQWQRYRPAEQQPPPPPPLQGYQVAGDTRLSQCHAAREGIVRGRGGSPAPDLDLDLECSPVLA